MKDKIKLTDRRVLLSNRYIQTLKPKDKRYSKGDSEVIGLRIFVFAGGQKTFYYSYTAKNKEHGLEKLGLFGSVNLKEARNVARKIAKEVMEGRSPIEIKISRASELTVGELVNTFFDKVLRAPKYKPSTQSKWRTNAKVWIFQKSKDPLIRAMYAKKKLKVCNKKISDKAKKCPNCGYEKQDEKKWTTTNYIMAIGAAIAVIYLILQIMSPPPKKVIQKPSAEDKNSTQSRYYNATQDQKNCVNTLRQGVYKDKPLAWKLDSCNVK